MRNWHLYKNNETASPCWQLYYETEDGRRRYFDAALDYPTAAALRDALMDADIRSYAVEYVQTSNSEKFPSNKAFEYRKANMGIYKEMINLSKAYGADSCLVYERLVVDAIKTE